MINVKHRGGFSKTESFLKRNGKLNVDGILERYGQDGLILLRENTPKDTGRTSASWSYKVEDYSDGKRIVWSNSNINDGVNVAILIQYGHGTNHGAYVRGVDYINPSIQPLFTQMANDIWEEVVGK